MLGIVGKVLGGVAGGLLDKIGLGKIAPFVKLGLNALTGNWLGVAKDVFSLVSNFKGNFLNKAARQPPLGRFEQPFTKGLLNNNSMSSFFEKLSNIFKGSNSESLGGLGKIFSAFDLLKDSFSNNQMYNNRASISMFTNIRL